MTPDVSTMSSVDMLCFLGVTGRDALLPRRDVLMPRRDVLMPRRDVSGGAMRVDEETT